MTSPDSATASSASWVRVRPANLGAITGSEDERAALIERLYIRDDSMWLAELFTDLDTDEMLRLQITQAPRLVLPVR
jgi:hypothetical protein